MIAGERGELPVEDGAFRAHEQARAYQDLEEEVIARTREIEGRRQVAEGLRELLAVVNTGGSLDDILNVTLAQATRLLQSDAGAVYLVGGKPGVVFLRATLGHAPGDMIQE